MTFSSGGPGKNISTGPKIRIEKIGYILREITEKNRKGITGTNLLLRLKKLPNELPKIGTPILKHQQNMPTPKPI